MSSGGNMMSHHDVTRCYNRVMNNEPRYGFMDDLRAHVKAVEKHEFDRNWTIFAARQEKEKVNDIAEAAKLSRMQVSRIINELTALTDDILGAHPDLILQDVIDHAWTCKSWDDFDRKPILKGARYHEPIVIHRDKTFEFDGVKYIALYGGPGGGYEVSTADMEHGTDLDALTLRELRDELNDRAEKGYPIRWVDGGDTLMNDGTLIKWEDKGHDD